MQRYQATAVIRSAFTVVLLASGLVTGCASPSNLSIEEQLSDKTLQWADALMGQDYDGAMKFMTPGYQSSPRATRFRADFIGATFWQDAEIKWVKCDEENGALVGSDVTGATENAGDANSIKGNASDSDSADACVLGTWESCGQTSSFSASSTVSTSGDRCEARLILRVMKPPEMSFPLTMPYDVTWLNLDGSWYIYHQ